jgi:hypothetical protein
MTGDLNAVNVIMRIAGKNDDTFLIDDRVFHAAEIGRIHAKAA